MSSLVNTNGYDLERQLHIDGLWNTVVTEENSCYARSQAIRALNQELERFPPDMHIYLTFLAESRPFLKWFQWKKYKCSPLIAKAATEALVSKGCYSVAMDM